MNVLDEQIKARNERKNYAIATIVEADGSTPRTTGKMIVFEDGLSKGTIGGGSIELLAKKDAVACIKAGANAYKHYDLTSELSNTGMTCGGHLSVFIEVYKNNPLLVMCGGGHVGLALSRIAKVAGFDVMLFDNRPSEVIADTIACADYYCPVESFEEGIRQTVIEPGAHYVIATYGHSQDENALAAVLEKDTAYIGMVGSSKKVAALFEKMRKRGYSDEKLSEIYTPIGLDIGGETPGEIAVSIMAEILSVKYQLPNAIHMKDTRKRK